MSIKNYFAFTRGEKRGAVVLLVIIVLLIIAQFSTDFLKEQQQTDFSEFESQINAFEKELKENNKPETVELQLFDFNPNTISDDEWKQLGFKEWQIKTINNYKVKGGNWKTKSDVAKIYGLDSNHYKQLKPYILLPENIKDETKNYKSDNNIKPTYFKFNPNTISKSKWEKLGFKDWQIKTIFNYKAKGGNWKTKSDVAKIYGLSDDDYQKLEPYILLPEKIENQPTTSKKDFSKKVNINTANKSELTNLKGIYSEKYAAIIIKYRNNLGGFVKKEQLLEVWNMKKETYEGFLPQVELGSTKPKQININHATAEELKKHPYLSWNTANTIVKYRKTHGNFKSVSEIKKIHLISDDLFNKIEPYLKTK